jgi:heat shock protein HslJ
MGRLVPYVVTFSILVAFSVAMSILQPAGQLTGVTWQWTASTGAGSTSPTVVPDPSRYTIRFETDGTIEARADCNTMVACGAGSLSDAYVADLAMSAHYRIVDGRLGITLADGSSMSFRPG